MNRLTLTLIIVFLTACQPFGPAASPLGAMPADTPEPSPQPTSLEEDPAGAVWWPPTPGPARLCAQVTAHEALHLRTGPSEKSAHSQYLHHGETLTVTEIGKWWKVVTKAGVSGYANAKFLEAIKCPS